MTSLKNDGGRSIRAHLFYLQADERGDHVPLSALSSLVRRGRAASAQWFVARKNCHLDDGTGRLEGVFAGVTHVAGDHPWVREHPDVFEPEARRQANPRGSQPPVRTAARARIERWRLSPLPPRRVDVELRTDTGDISVSLNARALDVLGAEARRSEDGLETGGPLFGPRFFTWHRSIDVRVADGPGPNAVRSEASLDRDIFDRIQLRHQLQRANPDITEIGDWHTHPAGRDVPSPEDLRAWQDDMRVLDNSVHLSLIATPDPVRGWRSPHWHPWVLRRKSFGSGLVCERAEILNR
jgi:integrative and conjugative element protein (TIGR02256 family)